MESLAHPKVPRSQPTISLPPLTNPIFSFLAPLHPLVPPTATVRGGVRGGGGLPPQPTQAAPSPRQRSPTEWDALAAGDVRTLARTAGGNAGYVDAQAPPPEPAGFCTRESRLNVVEEVGYVAQCLFPLNPPRRLEVQRGSGGIHPPSP